MPAAYIRFEPNQPQQFALTNPQGREVQGKFGPQFYHSCVGGRIVYFPPILETKIGALGVQKNELIEVTKVQNGAGKAIEWKIERVPQAAQPTPAPAPVKHTVASNLMASAMIASIDAALTAREYAKSKGIDMKIDLDFNAEDLQDLASTLFIQAFRPEAPWAR